MKDTCDLLHDFESWNWKASACHRFTKTKSNNSFSNNTNVFSIASCIKLPFNRYFSNPKSSNCESPREWLCNSIQRLWLGSTRHIVGLVIYTSFVNTSSNHIMSWDLVLNIPFNSSDFLNKKEAMVLCWYCQCSGRCCLYAETYIDVIHIKQ